MSEEPVVAQKGPYKVDLRASEYQPFCDGSHKSL
jgi:hypothetical protein